MWVIEHMPTKAGRGGRRNKVAPSKALSLLQRLGQKSEQMAITKSLQHVLADAVDPTTPVIPGLPRYLSRGPLLTACQRLDTLAKFGATTLHQNPVSVIKAALQGVDPRLLAMLHEHVQHLAYIEPGVLATPTHTLTQRVVGWGLAWPSISLPLAHTYLSLTGDVRHAVMQKVLDDVIKLRLDDVQFRGVVAGLKTILHYTPYLLGDTSQPVGDGSDFVPAVHAILAVLSDVQVQQVCGMAVVALCTQQPDAQSWFYGLDVRSLTRYMCSQGFRLHASMCAQDFGRAIPLKRPNNRLTT